MQSAAVKTTTNHAVSKTGTVYLIFFCKVKSDLQQYNGNR